VEHAADNPTTQPTNQPDIGPPELDTADEAASTVDRATPCRLYRELSRRSTAAGSAAFTPTVPGSSGLATYHHQRNAAMASDQSSIPPRIRTHTTHAQRR